MTTKEQERKEKREEKPKSKAEELLAVEELVSLLY
jgi:hypothetical protein